MSKPNSLRQSTIVLVVRVIMAIAFAYYLFAITSMWVLAFAGDTSEIFDFVDGSLKSGKLVWWQFAIGIAVCAIALASIGLIFWSIHRFFSRVSSEQPFGFATIRAIRNIALGMIGFWLGFHMIQTVLPALFMIGNVPVGQRELNWNPLNLELLFGIIGFTLLAVATLLRRAHDMDEEMKQIV